MGAIDQHFLRNEASSKPRLVLLLCFPHEWHVIEIWYLLPSSSLLIFVEDVSAGGIGRRKCMETEPSLTPVSKLSSDSKSCYMMQDNKKGNLHFSGIWCQLARHTLNLFLSFALVLVEQWRSISLRSESRRVESDFPMENMQPNAFLRVQWFEYALKTFFPQNIR